MSRLFSRISRARRNLQNRESSDEDVEAAEQDTADSEHLVTELVGKCALGIKVQTFKQKLTSR